MNIEIKVLDPLTASKIAAGEVVERPINVVKELVENSLDAKADRVTIELLDGGAELIRVTDNGKGIKYSELLPALARFATSKAESVEDVYNISTYGFRGEALAAISSVSDFMLKSVRDGDSPGEVRSVFGEISAPRPAAVSKGTQATVIKIFENLPVRKKFLKSSKANLIEILKYIKQMSFHNCGVEFIVFSDGKEVYRTYAANSMLELAKFICSEDSMAYHESVHGRYSVRVCVSSPSVQKKRRDSIYIGVNGRVVKDPALVQAVIQAYHRLMPANVYPCAMVDIKVNPSSVDVNIHPTKSEVRFEVPSEIFHVVRGAVEKALFKFTSSVYTEGIEEQGYLEERQAVKKNVEEMPFISANIEKRDVPPFFASDKSVAMKRDSGSFNAFDLTKELNAEYTNRDELLVPQCSPADSKGTEDSGHNKLAIENTSGDVQLSSEAYGNGETALKVLGQMKNMYIICENENADLVIIDQHVAHERILFEKYKAEKSRAVPSVILYEPLIVKLADDELLCFDEFAVELEKFGYSFEMFGSNDIKIMSVPVDIVNKNIKKEFTGLIADAMDLKRSRTQDAAIVMMSCRNAVKAGDHLSPYEMQHLVDTLMKTRNPHTCPHGRPIIFKLNASELAKKFQR